MPRESRQVKPGNRPAIYGRPQPVRKRSSRPEIKLNLRATLSLIGLALIITWWWRAFRLSTVTISGSHNYSSSLISSEVQAELHRHWWWRNLTLVDTANLQKQLLAAEPQLASVAISRHWPHQLILQVTERKPNLGWQTGDKTYLLSQEGIIVAPAQDSKLKLPVVEDTTNLPVKLGDQVAPAGFVAFTLEADRLLAQQGYQVTNLKIPVTTNEVDIYTNKGYFIKFDTTRSIVGEMGDLSQVLTLLKSQNKTPSQYIDLRIDGSAYYK